MIKILANTSSPGSTVSIAATLLSPTLFLAIQVYLPASLMVAGWRLNDPVLPSTSKNGDRLPKDRVHEYVIGW